MNNYIIELEKDKQPFFESIYSLEPMELEILKTYIKTNLANTFICFFKFPIKAIIHFNQKLNKSFYLYIDYQNFNNIIIKN